ncbi:hypothetical protein [Hafnia psychrotolerans]|uniref:Uncharacterized protein n=1 Tax=Hafnia psychrotolerans TaxID=1477018 RepID=A0ABQ1GYC6_9GAMM|nr:hypothetical protein [Hafnia psychrotolerans]GGA52140.1 hypothetical protein GCM10011328_29530 [Hafnia psychrotolerans]
MNLKQKKLIHHADKKIAVQKNPNTGHIFKKICNTIIEYLREGDRMKRLIPYENNGKDLSISYLQHLIDAPLSDIEELLVSNLCYYSTNV